MEGSTQCHTIGITQDIIASYVKVPYLYRSGDTKAIDNIRIDAHQITRPLFSVIQLAGPDKNSFFIVSNNEAEGKSNLLRRK